MTLIEEMAEALKSLCHWAHWANEKLDFGHTPVFPEWTKAKAALAKYSQHEQTDDVDEERIAQLIMDESGEISPQDAGNAAYEILKLLRQPDPRTEKAPQGDLEAQRDRYINRYLQECDDHAETRAKLDALQTQPREE